MSSSSSSLRSDAKGPQPKSQEKLLQEKSEAYPFLWDQVLATEARTGLPLPVLKAAFLAMDGATATSLNDRLEESLRDQARASRDRLQIRCEFLQMMIDLVDDWSREVRFRYVCIAFTLPRSLRIEFISPPPFLLLILTLLFLFAADWKAGMVADGGAGCEGTFVWSGSGWCLVVLYFGLACHCTRCLAPIIRIDPHSEACMVNLWSKIKLVLSAAVCSWKLSKCLKTGVSTCVSKCS